MNMCDCFFFFSLNRCRSCCLCADGEEDSVTPDYMSSADLAEQKMNLKYRNDVIQEYKNSIFGLERVIQNKSGEILELRLVSQQRDVFSTGIFITAYDLNAGGAAA